MTTTSVYPVTSYLPAGSSTGPFATVWGAATSAEILVRTMNAAGDTIRTLALGPDFTAAATGGDGLANGWDVTLQPSGVPAGGWAGGKVVIERLTVTDQQTDMGDTEGFRPSAQEAALDKLTRMAQELRGLVANRLALAPAETGMMLPGVEARKGGKAFGFDAETGAPQMIELVSNLIAAAAELIAYKPTWDFSYERNLRARGMDRRSLLDFFDPDLAPARLAGTDFTDMGPIYLNAINAVNVQGGWNPPYYRGGGQVDLNPGVDHHAHTFDVKDRSYILQGTAGNAYGGASSQMLFPAETVGIIGQNVSTAGETTKLLPPYPGFGGDGSELRHIYIESAGGVDPTKHGILMRNHMGLVSIQVAKFPGNGIYISADVTRPTGSVDPHYGNANLAYVIGGSAYKNGLSGLKTIGGDANVVLIERFDASQNKRYGLELMDFLSGVSLCCHTSGNLMGGVKTTNQNAPWLLLGLYEEGDQPKSDIAAPTLMVGGLKGPGPPTGSGCFMNVGTSPAGILQVNHGFRAYSDFGAGSTNDFRYGYGSTLAETHLMNILRSDMLAHPWILKLNAGGGPTWLHGNLTARNPLEMEGELTALTYGRSAAQPYTVRTDGLFVGNGGSARHVGSTTSAPTQSGMGSTLTAKGDIWLNLSAAAGGKALYCATTAGDLLSTAVVKLGAILDP